MSAYNHPSSRHDGFAISNTGFPSSSPHNKVSFPVNPFVPSREFTEHSSSEGPTPSRAMLTQSVICTPRNDAKPKFQGLNKLESMARHVSTTQNEDFPCQKHNSADKAPFSRAGVPSKDTFASQMMFPKSPSNNFKHEEEKRICTEPSNPIARRRRESVDLQAFVKKEGMHSDKFRFMRTPPFQPLSSNQEKGTQKNDCESTNSGSGPEMLKIKNFDFLKKKREVKEDKQPSSAVFSKSVKVFQPLKKSEITWPLSISPMEQKMFKTFDYSDQTSSSASKAESQLGHLDLNPNVHSAIEFKKKKNLESPATPPSLKPQQSRPEQCSRFNPKASTPESKPEQIPFFKSRSAKQRKEFSIDDFQILNKLGKGAFGEVFIAQEKVLGLVCVIKKMSKKRIREAKVEQHIIREIKLQSYFNNSHITSLYGYFHDQDHLYLILELLPDGSLQQVKKKRKLPEKEAADILRQVALGLRSMHQEFVIHRDLKPENLFLNEGYVKIGDLGCSIYHNDVGLRNTIVGCLEYSSPEQLSKEGYTQKIDSWSMGIMTYELLYGKSPFESDIKKMVINKEGAPNLSQVSFPSAPPVSDEAKEFILNLLDCDPDRRMDMDEVLVHPFIRQQK